jgi:hypothetical protein
MGPLDFAPFKREVSDCKLDIRFPLSLVCPTRQELFGASQELVLKIKEIESGELCERVFGVATDERG